MAKEFERTETKTTTKPAPTDQSATAFGYVDLSWITRGERPTMAEASSIPRKDGHFLGYRGKRINAIYGDPEACKSWLTYFAMKLELEQGGNCLLLNLDNDDETEVVNRLELLGIKGSVIADPSRFRIYQPVSAQELEAVLPETQDFRASMVGIDSFGGVLTRLGFDSLKDNDVRECWNENIQPFGNRDNECAVWVIDHLTKNQVQGRRTDSPYGSAAKKQLIRGCLVRAEVQESFAPEAIGRVRLYVEKDNSGRVRQFCEKAGNSNERKLFGDLELNATDPERVSAQIHTPSPEVATQRPTVLMERISDHLTAQGFTSAHKAISLNYIHENVIGKTQWLTKALETLKQEGYVAGRPWQANDGRGARSDRYWLVMKYKEGTDPLLTDSLLENLNLTPSPTPSQLSSEGERTSELSNPALGVRSSGVQGEINDDDGLEAWREPLPPQGGAA
jgi:hypothetical protein